MFSVLTCELPSDVYSLFSLCLHSFVFNACLSREIRSFFPLRFHDLKTFSISYWILSLLLITVICGCLPLSSLLTWNFVFALFERTSLIQTSDKKIAYTIFPFLELSCHCVTIWRSWRLKSWVALFSRLQYSSRDLANFERVMWVVFHSWLRRDLPWMTRAFPREEMRKSFSAYSLCWIDDDEEKLLISLVYSHTETYSWWWWKEERKSRMIRTLNRVKSTSHPVCWQDKGTHGKRERRETGKKGVKEWESHT